MDSLSPTEQRVKEDLVAWREERQRRARANALLMQSGNEHLVHHSPGQIEHRNWQAEPRLDLKRSRVCARRTSEHKSDRLVRQAELMEASGFLAPKRIVRE